jgi:hypothetical protein
MKKLLALCLALCFALLLIPAPSPGQTPGTRVRVEVDVPPPPTRTVYATAPAPPPITYPAAGSCISRSAGAGCSGFAPAAPLYAGGSCHGRTAGGCTGYVRAAGCQGGGPAGYAGYAAAMPAYAVPVYGAPLGSFATAYGPAPYGSRLPDGRYATPTGRPEPPRLIPSNDPVTRTARFLFGFDPNY